MENDKPLLSIAIPAYDRAVELVHCLTILVEQIEGVYEDRIEIVVSDDASPGDSLRAVRELTEKYPFIRFQRYDENVGLEQNLIRCTEPCRGEFLWIFGDDDFLETPEALKTVVEVLEKGQHDFLILNRTRRSFDLKQVLTTNWMGVEETARIEFPGLREFCLRFGFISVIGFISVNVFRREPFIKVDKEPYWNTMYPQLGAMFEAFHDRRTLLIGKPLVCHRTQTAEEKRRALGEKASEARFMADERVRNATYFSHPFICMLDNLVEKGVLKTEDLIQIPENTVIHGLLVDFLINTTALSREIGIQVADEDWRRTERFLTKLPLNPIQRRRVKSVMEGVQLGSKSNGRENPAACSGNEAAGKSVSAITSGVLTLSVVSVSYNQAKYLPDCLQTVRDQTYPAVEHLVYDPGSTDGSRQIVRRFRHATLVAEPDQGQSDALNKGFARSKGDIIAWLNSDDYYADCDVFKRVVERFDAQDSPDIVYGRGVFVDASGKKLRDVYVNKDPSSLWWRFQQEDGILQPALFMRRSLFEKVGELRKDLHYSMDYEYWIRCLKEGAKFAFLDDDLAVARYHPDNKTFGMRGKSYAEVCDMMKEHFGYVNHIWLKRYAEFLADGHDGVLATAHNVGVRDEARLETIYCQLLKDYNTSHDVWSLLNEKASMRGHGDTLREMKRRGIKYAVPCRESALSQDSDADSVCYTVGPRRWSFDRRWKAGQIHKAHEFLRLKTRTRSKDTCFIVGNGPSLNKSDLSLLEGQDVIVSNCAFLSDDLMKHATYFTTVNYLVAEQNAQRINRLEGIHKVLPYWLAYCLNPGRDTYFVNAVGHPEFSTDIFTNMSWRHTVSFFNLHLAYGLGYRRAVLLGFDHSFRQPNDVQEQDIIESTEDDVNHFHPDYFRGKRWQAADVDMMEAMYKLAYGAYRADSREILNATVGGKLELFPRITLADAVSQVGSTLEEPVSKYGEHVMGPYGREEKASLDEVRAVHTLLDSNERKSVMIDVGAHHGYALEPFLKSNWLIHAFEPDPHNYQKLLDRIKDFDNLDNLNLDRRCVSNEKQDNVSFFTSDVSSGISSLSAFHDSHQDTHRVDTITLADYLDEAEVLDVDFLKIDTEGHDLFVLKGFPWKKYRPSVIVAEFENSKTEPLGYRFEDMADFLAALHYTVYVSEWHPIVRYGVQHNWRRLSRYPCSLLDAVGWGNLIAFRNADEGSQFVKAMSNWLQLEVSKEINKRDQSCPPDSASSDFRRANELLRDGEYERAIDIYKELYKSHRLTIYTWNISFAERRLQKVKNCQRT